MKLAIYGDAHITRKMNNLQDDWDTSVLNMFKDIYQEFQNSSVDAAVCLGDIFDKAVLEARSVQLVTKVLSIINSSNFPTYILLGNHEIYDYDGSNILEYLREYNNIIPVTIPTQLEDNLVFLPYNTNLEELSLDIKNKYLFTHCDIYGSAIAGGLVLSSFGIDPSCFSSAKRVFNGHVHLNSTFSNIINVGSLTKMSHGELIYGESPQYFILDSKSGSLESFSIPENFFAYISIDMRTKIEDIFNTYPDSVKFVIRVLVNEEIPTSFIEELKSSSRVLKVTTKKLIEGSIKDTEIVKKSLDIREAISSYVERDASIEDAMKPSLVELGIKLLESK